jgi:hypothetical protein
MSCKIVRFSNRKALKGLNSLYRENKKSDDGTGVEFFHLLNAPDDLACISGKSPTSMLITLTPLQHMTWYQYVGVSLERQPSTTHFPPSDDQSERHSKSGTSSAFENSDQTQVMVPAGQSAGVLVIFLYSKITAFENFSLAQTARDVYWVAGTFPMVGRMSPAA